MDQRRRWVLLELFATIALLSLTLLIVFCVMDLKPYLETRNYVKASCFMESKEQNAGEGSCDCGRLCWDTESCGAAFANVPSTGVKHALVNLDEAETSDECTAEGFTCGFPYDVDELPPVGANFSCLYDPDNHNRVICHHQSKSFLFPAVIVPGSLFVIFMGLFCGFGCYFYKKGLLDSAVDTKAGFSRLKNEAI